MPGINLTPYINPRGELGDIPQSSLESLRHQGQGTRSFQVQLGELNVAMRFISPGHFMGLMLNADPQKQYASMIRNIETIESLVNITGQPNSSMMYQGPGDHMTADFCARTLQLLDKIDSCCFNVEEAGFQVAGEYLTCPITLSIPEERGIFARTSLQSDVCHLYDLTSLKEFVSTSHPHLLSNERITAAYIVPKEQCHFDSERGAFVHFASSR